MVTQQRPFTDPTFPPVAQSDFESALSPNKAGPPVYFRKPTQSVFEWTADDTSVATVQGTYVLQVSEPSLVRLINITNPGLAVTDTASLDVFWRPFGTPGNPTNLYFNFNSQRRQPFIGPYAYLPAPGLYELCAALNSTVGVNLNLRAELQRGVTPLHFESIIRANNPSHWASRTSANMGLGATTSPVADVHGSFMLLRRVRIQNTGAGQLDVILGNVSGAPVSRFELLTQETIELKPDQLGRSTIVVNAIAATSFTSHYALW